MAKIILLALAFLAVYWLLRSYRRRVDRDAAPPTMQGESMVQCAQCGVHLPRSEGIASRGNFYCSADHQRLHQGEGGG